MTQPVSSGAEVVPERRVTPWRSWVALFLVLGPLWWIALPWVVNKVLLPLPEAGLLIGPLLSFLTAFAGLVVAIYAIDRADERGWSTTLAWVCIAIFAGFTVLFAVAFVVMVVWARSHPI